MFPFNCGNSESFLVYTHWCETRCMQRDRTVFIIFRCFNKQRFITGFVASGVQLRNGFSGDLAFSARSCFVAAQLV